MTTTSGIPDPALPETTTGPASDPAGRAPSSDPAPQGPEGLEIQQGLRSRVSGAARRTGALARAEWQQFRRNTTLIVLAAVFPLLFALGYYMLLDRQVPGTPVPAGTAAGSFLIFTLIFVPFYSVLSMATTRRDEGVLKRLRTGQASDTEILTAIAIPGSVLSLALLPVFVLLAMVMGAGAALAPLLMVVGLGLGLPIAVALALLTSGFTRDAEAAQISSLPVMALAMVSLSPMRMLLPDRILEVVDRTPFALLDNLAWLAWTGLTPADLAAGRPAASAGEAVGQAWPMLGMLALWAVALLAVVPRAMRWQTHR